MQNEGVEDIYPEVYDEDNTQRIIPSDQRRGLTDKPIKYKNLLQEDHWLNGLREEYDQMEWCKLSGRTFNGSDPILKDIESKQFKDPNLVYQNQKSRYTLESSYIYIISKVIGETQYYKVGEGGSGNKSSGPGRLGDAQTFLSIGLNEDVGFRVHYLLFFEKIHHPHVAQFLSFFIELKLHSNLRSNFRSASITFASGKPSEWYVVPKRDLCIFLGFIFDIVSSYKIRPLQIWKLLSNRNAMEVIKLTANWTTRMEMNPDYIEQDNDMNNLGSNIVVKQTYEEDVGSVAKFREHILGDFILPKQNNVSYTVVDFISNRKELKEGQPLQINTFYGIVTSVKKSFDEIKDLFSIQNFDILEIQLQPNQPTIKAKFYIHIKHLLKIYKINKYGTPRLFSKWPLKNIYQYYIGTPDTHTETYVMPNNFVAPPWFFNSLIQLSWAVKMTTEEEFMYHTDFIEDFRNNSNKYNWKSARFYTPQFLNSDDYYIERERVNANNDVIPNTKESVPIIRVMNAMSVHEIKPMGKSRKGKNFEISIPGELTIEGNAKKLIRGGLVELSDDYFTYYKPNRQVDDIENHKGKTFYMVKKIYEKSNHSKDLNPWMDIQEFPSTHDKRIWCIFLPDFKDEKLKGKLTIKAKTETEIKNLKKKLIAQEALDDRNRFARELERVGNPLFNTNDVIRMKPIDFPDYAFGEEETKRNEYHYAKIVQRIKLEGGTKSVQYEIMYFPPWDKNEIWGILPTKSKYTEKHLVSKIDEFAEKIGATNTNEFKIYKDNLKGKYIIELITNHYPNTYGKITSHEELIAKAQLEDEDAFYEVKWEGYEGVDKNVAAIGFYEDAPDAVKEYWKRLQPLNKRVTRSETRKANTEGGGKILWKGGKRVTRRKRRRKHR